MSHHETELIPLQLDNDVVVYVESTVLPGEEDVSFSILPFEDFTKVIEGVAISIVNSLKKISPDKTTVELGFQASAKSGKLSSILVQGEGQANIKVSLEWSK